MAEPPQAGQSWAGDQPGSPGGPPGDEGTHSPVAELAWKAGEKVEVPVRVVVEGGRDYVFGSGPPAGTLHTDEDAVLSVAAGEASPRDLEATGRWSFDGPADARQAFEETLSTTFDE